LPGSVKERFWQLQTSQLHRFVSLSDLVFYTPSEHSKVPLSLVGAVALIEALSAACTERFSDKFAAFTEFLSEILLFFYFEYPKLHGDMNRE